MAEAGLFWSKHRPGRIWEHHVADMIFGIATEYMAMAGL